MGIKHFIVIDLLIERIFLLSRFHRNIHTYTLRRSRFTSKSEGRGSGEIKLIVNDEDVKKDPQRRRKEVLEKRKT